MSELPATYDINAGIAPEPDPTTVYNSPGNAPAIEDPAGRSIASGSGISTQQQYPYRAVMRTMLVVIIAFVPVISVGLTYLASGQNRPSLPPDWQAWLSGAAAWVAFVSGALTRALANPIVDMWLAKIGLSSQPY
jgi:hypothetical protein